MSIEQTVSRQKVVMRCDSKRDSRFHSKHDIPCKTMCRK